MSEADACEECAEKCLLIHQKNRDPSSIVSSFFKVIIDDRFLRFLPVPPRFAPRLSSLVDQETRVEDSSGRKWTVTLSAVKDSLAFKKGWNAFSLDHGIELGDLLIFHYVLDSHFVVQIFGRSGCEKLILPLENNTVKNKRIRTTADGPSNRSDKDSGLCLATIPSNKGNLEEPCLMMVNRDTRIAGEEERIPFFDMFASEIVNIKAVGKVDDVQKGNGSSSAEDMVDNHNAVEDVLKDTIDANETREGNGDLEMHIMQIESAMGLEIPEQLHNGSSTDNILDYDTAFDDLLGDAPSVQMTEINEKGKNEFQWASEMDHKSSIATKHEINIWKTNSTDLPSSVLNVMEHNIGQVHISSGCHVDEEPKSAIGGNRSVNIRSDQKVSCSLAVIPVSEGIGQSVKVVKTEHKVHNQEQVGSEQGSNITVHENLNAAANAGEVGHFVKAEPVDRRSLQVACTVTPNSESFLEIPKGLPTGRAKVEEKVVILRDSVGRRWPVRYHEKNGLKALVYGWKSFSRANGIQSGDECVFTLEDQDESLYIVQVIHK